PPPSPAVPLLAGPTPVESVEMALVAASVTAVGVEKMALLTSARRVMATLRDAPEALKSEVARVFEDETRVEQAYRAALRNAVSRADVAVRQGQPRVVARLIAEVTDADARLGHRRPREVANVLKRLATEAALAGVQQAALKRWAEVKDQLQAYDVRVKRILAGWTSHEATLAAIQKESTASPGGLEAALRRFSELERALTALRPPDEMQDVHGVLRSAVLMARQGLIIGQRLAVAANTSLSRNASAAVRGASLLRARAFADLAKGMAPQRVR
ncbi:MAG: hypothetical protein HQ485_13750, partial [Acidobacteria bacterium]|nr:hypothetical protein [Acidobacteriota bacterium]